MGKRLKAVALDAILKSAYGEHITRQMNKRHVLSEVLGWAHQRRWVMVVWCNVCQIDWWLEEGSPGSDTCRGGAAIENRGDPRRARWFLPK